MRSARKPDDESNSNNKLFELIFGVQNANHALNFHLAVAHVNNLDVDIMRLGCTHN